MRKAQQGPAGGASETSYSWVCTEGGQAAGGLYPHLMCFSAPIPHQLRVSKQEALFLPRLDHGFGRCLPLHRSHPSGTLQSQEN